MGLNEIGGWVTSMSKVYFMVWYAERLNTHACMMVWYLHSNGNKPQFSSTLGISIYLGVLKMPQNKLLMTFSVNRGIYSYLCIYLWHHNWKDAAAAAAAKSCQSCLTLCDPIDGSPPDSAVPGILQARTLEWVAISFSNAWKWKVKVKSLSRVQLFETPWTAACQAPLSVGLSRQEYWSGVPSLSPEKMLPLGEKMVI